MKPQARHEACIIDPETKLGDLDLGSFRECWGTPIPKEKAEDLDTPNFKPEF